jgi:hypothetical protein
VPGWHQKSFGKTQMRKLEKLRRDRSELHKDSAELHAERKCAPGPRETFSKAQER